MVDSNGNARLYGGPPSRRRCERTSPACGQTFRSAKRGVYRSRIGRASHQARSEAAVQAVPRHGADCDTKEI